MLLGFKKRFVLPIQIGTKVFTMRNKRKVEPKIGETIHMYTGLRTKFCERISNKEKLISTQRVRISIYRHPDLLNVKIFVDGRELNIKEIYEFVKFDGFKDVTDFADYWIESSTGKKDKKKVARVGGMLTLYHWTDLRY
jgi:hypothetical protein